MKLYLSEYEYTSKPNTNQIKKISSSILKNLVDIDMKGFAEEITTKGKTSVLAELTGTSLSKKTPIVGQELVMLDFDNSDDLKYTFDDLENDLFMSEQASFFYKTFGYEENKSEKFRVVFQLDRVVTSNSEIEEIYQQLFKRYPQADTTVGQTNRLFFGGTSSYEVIDFDNRLDTEELLKSEYDLTPTESSVIEGDIIDVDTPVYILLKLKRYDLIKEKLGDNYSGEFSDVPTASQYFKSLDMHEFLELPEGNPFLDILHEEENPSASVFLSLPSGVYLYKCFSQNKEFIGDILRLLQRYLGITSASEVTEILAECANCTFNFSSQLGRYKNDLKEFKYRMINNELEKSHPELFGYYKRYWTEISIVLDLVTDAAHLDKTTGELRYLNYFNLDSLIVKVEKLTNKKMSRWKMWTIINLIIVTEALSKVSHDELPKELLEDIVIKQEEGDQIRSSNFYEPVLDWEKSQEIARIMKENKVNVSSLSYELVYRLFGEEKAKQDFPQAYKPLIDNGLVKMSKLDKNLTAKQEKLEKAIVEEVFKIFAEQGYCFEKDLVSIVGKKTKTKVKIVKLGYDKIKPDLFQKYGIESKRATKKDYEKFNIQGKFVSKNILFQEE